MYLLRILFVTHTSILSFCLEWLQFYDEINLIETYMADCQLTLTENGCLLCQMFINNDRKKLPLNFKIGQRRLHMLFVKVYHSKCQPTVSTNI